jgi:hypothetical protein
MFDESQVSILHYILTLSALRRWSFDREGLPAKTYPKQWPIHWMNRVKGERKHTGKRLRRLWPYLQCKVSSQYLVENNGTYKPIPSEGRRRAVGTQRAQGPLVKLWDLQHGWREEAGTRKNKAHIRRRRERALVHRRGSDFRGRALDL